MLHQTHVEVQEVDPDLTDFWLNENSDGTRCKAVDGLGVSRGLEVDAFLIVYHFCNR